MERFPFQVSHAHVGVTDRFWIAGPMFH